MHKKETIQKIQTDTSHTLKVSRADGSTRKEHHKSAGHLQQGKL